MISSHTHYTFLKNALMVIMASAVLTSGCSTTHKMNPALQRARTAYAHAQSDPKITDHAPVAMYEASQMLQEAEQAKEVKEMEHLAYLAERRAQIAVVVAERRIAEKEIESLGRERNRVLLEARELEAERAKEEVEMERSKAEAMASEAEKALKQAQLERTRLEQLQSELSELQARQTDRGAVLTLGDILFATDKADLMPGAMRSIDNLSAFLQKYPDRQVLIEGYTDSTGDEEYNIRLSQHRADAVRNALIFKGISPNRIVANGYGEDYPVADNTSSAGRQQNRRVEIVILEEGEKGEKMPR
jgi:outer membrane protein OmpA-like peptidoglycan-associated protein